jgi:hypothetical protein
MISDNTVYEWHISVVMQYTEDFKLFEYPELIKSIEAQLSTTNLKFTVFRYFVPDAPEKPGSADIIQYYKGAVPAPTVNWANINIWDPNMLKKFFRKYVAKVNCSRHMVLLWGHGAGLGYFPYPEAGSQFTTEQFNKIFKQYDVGDDKNLTIDRTESKPQDLVKLLSYLKANTSKKINLKPQNRMAGLIVNNDIKYTISDVRALDESIRVLTAYQLAGILKVIGKKVNLLISANCYSQFFEVGYVLKEQVEFLVAPQTFFPSTSINYNKLFASMQRRPATTYSLARNVCINFMSKYKDKRYMAELREAKPNYKVKFKQVSLSGNNLSYYEPLLEYINELAIWLIKNFSKKVDSTELFYVLLREARRLCYDPFDPIDPDAGIMDFLHFVKQLQYQLKKTGNVELNERLKKIKDLRKQICSKAFLPASFKGMYQDIGNGRPSLSPYFLSVFCISFDGPDDPKFRELYHAFYEDGGSRFGKLRNNYKWDNFVRKYFRYFHAKGDGQK